MTNDANGGGDAGGHYRPFDPEFYMIQSMLERIERQNNIKIVYAAETGPRAWSLDSRLTPYDVNFVYVRNNIDNTVDSSDNSTFVYTNVQQTRIDVFDIVTAASADDRFQFTGFDLNVALKLVGNMYPSMVEMFYSPHVYRMDTQCSPLTGENYARLADMVRHALDAPVSRRVRLLQRYRQLTIRSHDEFVNKYPVEQEPLVPLDEYVSLVRKMVTFQWLVLTYASSLDTNTDAASHVDPRFIELSIDQAMHDLHKYSSPTRAYVQVVKEDLFSAVWNLMHKYKQQTASNKVEGSVKSMSSVRVPRNARIDMWMSRCLNQDFSFIRKRPDLTEDTQLLNDLNAVLDTFVRSN